MADEVLKFRKASDAVEWLRKQGFKLSAPLFSQHKARGWIPRGDDGTYASDMLLAYAGAHLQLTARIEDKEARSAAIDKLSADSVLKSIKAEREKLRLEKERGALMPVAQHDADLAARAVFFRSEIESFIIRKAADIIAVTGGREETGSALITWWEDATADWLDAFSSDREFTAGDDDQDEDSLESSTRMRDSDIDTEDE